MLRLGYIITNITTIIWKPSIMILLAKMYNILEELWLGRHRLQLSGPLIALGALPTEILQMVEPTGHNPPSRTLSCCGRNLRVGNG